MEWEVILGAVGRKTSQISDANESMESKSPTLMCQESGLDINLQGSRVFTLLIKQTRKILNNN